MNHEDQTEKRETVRPARRGLWVLVLLAAMLVLFGGFLALMAYVSGAASQGFMPPQMAAAYRIPKDLVGDLGGMPVRIDRHIVRLVEYDGDPGWGEKRKGPPPERTHASRLASFGFYVRYPDMRSLNEPEMRDDFERYHPTTASTEYGIKEKNPWLDGGIQSGASYPGRGFLDRLYAASLLNPDQQPGISQFVPQPSPVKGLELYVLSGTDPLTGNAWRYERSWSDRYVHRDRQGKATTYIRCSYQTATRRPTSCTHEWSMEEHGLSMVVSVNYRHGLLPQWQDIQTKVSDFVLKWQDPTAPHTPTSTPATGTRL
jgi:hypothetical protein